MSLARMLGPGATIGIIGGGQLGQMLASSAVEMGFHVIVLDPTPDCPAAREAEQIVAAYDNEAAMRELADRCDVLTYEFENVSARTLGAVADRTWVPQGTLALQVCQDRLTEKEFLERSGVPIAPHASVPSAADLAGAVAEIGYPAVLKTVRGGYDGKGQVVLRGDGDLEAGVALADGAPCVMEAFVDFDREISVVVGGNPQGEYVTFPVGENIHVNNILHQSVVPARVPDSVVERAEEVAVRIARDISLVGVMGVEMFAAPGGQIFVNELAPRPHNSGHYTIEACTHSQFDLHVRGVCGWPLPKPRLLSPALMTNVLGQHMEGTLAAISAYPDWSFHLYGKEAAKRDRKMGHITVLCADPEVALAEASASGIWNASVSEA